MLTIQQYMAYTDRPRWTLTVPSANFGQALAKAARGIHRTIEDVMEQADDMDLI